AYDAADRLTSKAENGAATTYAYDPAGQLTGAGAATFGYDAAGNRTNTGYVTGAGNQMTNDGVWTYTYNDAGRVTQRSKGASAETWEYRYDHDGRLLTSWKSATAGGAPTAQVTYAYDGWGNRVSRAAWDGVSTTTERYGLDGWDTAQPPAAGNENFRAWADLDGSNALTSRRDFGGAFDDPVAVQTAAGAVSWYAADHLGSVRLTTDAAGVPSGTAAYDAWGVRTAGTGAVLSDRYGYAGAQWDSLTGLTGYGNGRRDRGAGPWLQPDPIGFGGGDPNVYRYVSNAPTNFVDPSGMSGDPPLAGGSGNDGMGGGGGWWGPPGGGAWAALDRGDRPDLHDGLPDLHEVGRGGERTLLWTGGGDGARTTEYRPERDGGVGSIPAGLFDWVPSRDEVLEFAGDEAARLADKSLRGSEYWGIISAEEKAQAMDAARLLAGWTVLAVFDYVDRAPEAGQLFHDAGQLFHDQFWKEDDPNLNSIGPPGFWDGLAPVYGPGRTAINAFQQGRYGSGVVNGGLAVADLFPAYSLVKGGFRLAGRLFGSGAAREAPRLTQAQIAAVQRYHAERELLRQRAPTQVAEGAAAQANKEMVEAAAGAAAKADVAAHVASAVATPAGGSVARGGFLGRALDVILGPKCFAAGTPLLTPDGWKPVEAFREGDLVLSRPEGDQFGFPGPKPVEAVFVRVGPTRTLTVSGREIVTTYEHPFFVLGRGWVLAGELVRGDVLSSHNGEFGVVEAVAESPGMTTLYNLRVADWHTYFVGKPEWGFSLWAHNANYEVREVDGVLTLFEKGKSEPVHWANGGGPRTFGSQNEADEVLAGLNGTLFNNAAERYEFMGTQFQIDKHGVPYPVPSRVTGAALEAKRVEFNGMKPDFWKREARENPHKYTPDQLTKMRQGEAPIGSDGLPMEIHHKLELGAGGENVYDNLAFMTFTDHRGKGNFKKNHPNIFSDK
ncbi:MAG: hypothetical protein K2X82_14515, partial [Gemmataceae bacterium]|nr:hypothetical protein [Gemmataceae bacterium]